MLDDDETRPQASEEMPEDPDEAFAWLESLAAQHGADEEALSTPIEERDSTTPDWLQEISEPSLQTQPESERKVNSDETPSGSEPILGETIADDVLPDWLQDLDASAISNSTEQEDVPDPISKSAYPANGKFTDWLSDLDKDAPVAMLPDEEIQDQPTTPISDAIPPQTTSNASLPDWLQEISDETISELEQETESTLSVDESLVPEIPSTDQHAASLSVPDWMKDLADEESGQPVDESTTDLLQDSQIDLPDWMRSEDQTTEELAPAARSASIPDWLEELKPADSEPATLEEVETDAEAEQAAEPEPPKSAPPAVSSEDEPVVGSHKVQDEVPQQDSEEMPEDADDAFAWLESLAAKHGADEEALFTAADERQETPPDWIQHLSSTEETQPDDIPPRPDTLSISDLDTGVDLLNAAEEIPTEPSKEEEDAEAKAHEWLQSLASGKPVEDLAVPSTDEIYSKLDEELEETPLEAASTSSADEMPSDPAEAFAWLESLAAQHGADEEALSTPPEERDSTTPDWLQNIEEDLEPQPQQKVEPVDEDIFGIIQEETDRSETVIRSQKDEMPSDPAEAFAWLESLAAQQGADEEALFTPPEERDSTTPDWLQDIDDEIDMKEPEQESEPVEEDAFLPAAKDEMTVDQPPQTGPATETTLPAWLKEFEEPLTETSPAQSEPQDETVVRWLNKMDEEENLSDEPVIEPSSSRSASKDVITEPVKPAEQPSAEKMPADVEIEPQQPIAKEPDAEIIGETVQGSLPVERPTAQVEEQVPEPQHEAETELAVPPDLLANAQKLVSKGQIEESVAIYQTLIKEETRLEAVIKDLNDALLHHPVELNSLVDLG